MASAWQMPFFIRKFKELINMKKLIIILTCIVFVFAAVCIGITYWSISQNQPAPPTAFIPVEKPIDLYGTYDTNPILIDSLTEKIGDVEISIPQIKGLKDTSVQKKINDDMYAKAHQLLDKHDAINYANFYTYANFSNVVSISFNVGFDYQPYSDIVYFNYNLIDGSELKLEDLFFKDTDLLDIVRSSFYKSTVMYGNYDSETFIVSPNEEKLVKLVKSYMESDNKRFAFSPVSILFYSGDSMADARMIDYHDSITIYSKFLTEDELYTGEYENFKNLFTCSPCQYDIFEQIEYGYLEDNMWYDFTAGHDYIPRNEEGFDEEKVEKYTELKENMYEKFYELIKDYRKKAQNNPDTFYMVLFKPNSNLYVDSKYENGTWYNTFSNLVNISNSVYIYSMPLKVYEESFKDLITETYRYEYFAMRGGAYLFEDELPEGVHLETKTTSYLYNYITGEEYTSVKDLFFDDETAINSIEELVRERLSYQNNLPKDIDSLIDEMSLKLEYTKIIASFPSWEDYTVTMRLDNFDKSLLKIFD